jgi:hypothetical protein
MLKCAAFALAAVVSVGMATESMAKSGGGGGGRGSFTSVAHGGHGSIGAGGGRTVGGAGGHAGVKHFGPVATFPGGKPPVAGHPGGWHPGGGPKPVPPKPVPPMHPHHPKPPHHGHWGHRVVTGGAGYAAAHVVPNNEECFTERRRIQGVLRLVRTCADPYR